MIKSTIYIDNKYRKWIHVGSGKLVLQRNIPNNSMSINGDKQYNRFESGEVYLSVDKMQEFGYRVTELGALVIYCNYISDDVIKVYKSRKRQLQEVFTVGYKNILTWNGTDIIFGVDGNAYPERVKFTGKNRGEMC